MKTIYDSGFHHPLAAYVANFALLAFLAFLAARGRSRAGEHRFLAPFLVLSGVEILADAWVTGAWSPIAATSPAYQPLSILFVILGDFRFFFLALRLARPADSISRVLALATPISLVVPVLSGLGTRALPELFADSRVIFLSYELMLFALVLFLGAVLSRSVEPVSADDRVWLRRLFAFELVQYGGWALADVVILSGATSGYLLRIVPNVLYYAAFLPFVRFTSPSRQSFEAAPPSAEARA